MSGTIHRTDGALRPIIIVGAARSGTNILRDVLTRIPGLGSWPCDEINYIWRHGNTREPSDELTAEHARPEVRTFIRNSFRRIAVQQKITRVVEKTCANSLRIPFVDAVLPDATYIHLVRDGYDVTASAMKRWTAELDLTYVLRKARYVPVRDVPYYAVRYLKDRSHRLRSKEKRLAFWGPRFEGFREVADRASLAELCALQWQTCVDRSTRHLKRIPAERTITLRYERFVRDPERELARICEFLRIDLDAEALRRLSRSVSSGSVGKGRSELSSADVERISPIVDPQLERLEYDAPAA